MQQSREMGAGRQRGGRCSKAAGSQAARQQREVKRHETGRTGIFLVVTLELAECAAPPASDYDSIVAAATQPTPSACLPFYCLTYSLIMLYLPRPAQTMAGQAASAKHPTAPEPSRLLRKYAVCLIC